MVGSLDILSASWLRIGEYDMGVTPTYGLPYPNLSDVPDVPSDMRDLAVRTEAIFNRPQRMIHTPIQEGHAFFRTTAGTTSAWTVFAPNTRWQFIAPENGLLRLNASFAATHMGNISVAGVSNLDFMINAETLKEPTVGTISQSYPLYGRIARGPNNSGTATSHIDATITLMRNIYIPKGGEVGIMLMYRGELKTSAVTYFNPRITGDWSPGEVVIENAMTNDGYARPYTGSSSIVESEPGDTYDPTT